MTNPAKMKRSGPSVWHGEDLMRDQNWIISWTDAELAEIDYALLQAKSKISCFTALTKNDFPLDEVKSKLNYVADFLENNRGVIKLTGLAVDQYSLSDLQMIWMGIGCHLGAIQYQDYAGQLMRVICNEGADVGGKYGQLEQNGNQFLSSKARTYSNGVLRFHTDRVDVVGLLTVQQAERGGTSKVVSIEAVHNAILNDHPDLLDILYKPILRSRLGEEEGGEDMIYALPVFAVHEGKFTSHFSRTYIEAAQMLEDTPKLSDQQWQALDLLATTCEKLCYTMTLSPGDIQLLNNHVVYHARYAFEDNIAAGRVRRLLRLWLSMPNSRSLPADHKVLWGNVEAGAIRGGIGQSIQ